MKDYVKEAMQKVENVNSKYEKGEKLSHSETDTFCMHCAVLSKSYDSLPSICDDFKFSKLYLIYFRDLNFKSQYLKPNFGANIDFEAVYEQLNSFGESENKKDYYDNNSYDKQREVELQIGITRIARKEEVQSDKEFLEKCALDWNDIIEKTNHTNQRLQAISKEARDLKKLIDKKFSGGIIEENEKSHQINLILWKTKHIHLTAEEILEEIGVSDYKLDLNGKVVFFTYSTLIHILNRHFGELVSIQMLRDDKSFHNPIFQPNKIHLILESIFKKLSLFHKFQKEEIVHNKPFNFMYKGINYQMYLKLFGDKKDKLFISSVYPIDKPDELLKLLDFKLFDVDDVLGIYLSRH